MTFYRSATIQHYKLILPRQSAWTIMNHLGQKSIIHVEENPSNQILSKPFFSQVKRCEEGLVKLQQIEQMLKNNSIPYCHKDLKKNQFEELFQIWNKDTDKVGLGLEDIELEILKFWEYYLQLQKRIDALQQQIRKYRNTLAIMRAGQLKFGNQFLHNNQQRAEKVGYHPFSEDQMQQLSHNQYSSQLYFRTGVISLQEEFRFKKTVFRITKGNCFIHFIGFQQIFDTILKNQQDLLVFFILFPGRSGSYLDRKLNRLIMNYSDQSHQLPQKEHQVQKKMKQIQNSYHEAEGLLSMNEKELKDFLKRITEHIDGHEFTKIQYYKGYLLKEKQIYEKLNEMELYQNFIQGSIFVQDKDLEELQTLLNQIQKQSKHPAGQLISSSSSNFPTYFQLNSYTQSAQLIVQTYGVAEYKEANPSFFATITFPFLFGVMFGDIAHGLILFFFGLYLIFRYEDAKSNFILKIVLPHRYLLTLMGFFATYCGFIYNDYLSISLDLFGSCYNPLNSEPNEPIVRENDQCVYPFGLDPVWDVSQNNLNFVDSLKMKISVIIAVTHMTLGVFIKASNALYFKKYIDFFFEFIPQLLFMVLLFGYMDFLIIFKWLQPWELYDPLAPSIITTMINIPLKLGKTENCCGGEPLWGTVDNTSQNTIQLVFLLIAVICIPLMLIPKPLILIRRQKYKKISMDEEINDQINDGESIESPKSVLSSASSRPDKALRSDSQKSIQIQHNQDASEIFVHQLIQTIEYALGCISNTASYLRLWALSLAHSQLSQVFFEKTVQGGIAKGYSGIFFMFAGFIILAGATFGVLLCMDSMQCFLHTLRLHWVEFQNKFYKGNGSSWKSFSFKNKLLSELAS